MEGATTYQLIKDGVTSRWSSKQKLLPPTCFVMFSRNNKTTFWGGEKKNKKASKSIYFFCSYFLHFVKLRTWISSCKKPMAWDANITTGAVTANTRLEIYRSFHRNAFIKNMLVEHLTCYRHYL